MLEKLERIEFEGKKIKERAEGKKNPENKKELKIFLEGKKEKETLNSTYFFFEKGEVSGEIVSDMQWVLTKLLFNKQVKIFIFYFFIFLFFILLFFIFIYF